MYHHFYSQLDDPDSLSAKRVITPLANSVAVTVTRVFARDSLGSQILVLFRPARVIFANITKIACIIDKSSCPLFRHPSNMSSFSCVTVPTRETRVPLRARPSSAIRAITFPTVFPRKENTSGIRRPVHWPAI
jgi:hypothetical protein